MPELAREAVTRAITDTISASTVRRWLKDDALKPWQHRSWIFIRVPNFRATAQRVLDLYARIFDGASLGEDEYVISADGKTSIQARCRCHPTLAPVQARAMRVNHTYGCGGALAYLAAYDIHRAEVFGRCEQTTGIVPFKTGLPRLGTPLLRACPELMSTEETHFALAELIAELIADTHDADLPDTEGGYASSCGQRADQLKTPRPAPW
ncbi:hypothetical protein ACF05L_21535 [Streptomyces bobili]|uniref:hypothetical protein n=1 Tax=Streptomyces bobili TaxID=67280 RepID=UPI0037003BB3